MNILYLDCISGISGDMLVGALTDLGVPPSTFEWELGKVEIGDFHMHFERQSRQGIIGIKFGIHEGDTHTHDPDEPEHAANGEHHHRHEHAGCEHDHHEHSHGRNHREIRELIQRSELSAFVKAKALAVFQRIAIAEGKIHGVPAEAVAFHEVGALDSIADIICSCVAIEALDVDKILVSRLFDGCGSMECAHGMFPIPAPATLEILSGIPISQIDEPFEFITPTGAALVAEFGSGFGVMPELTIRKIGYGLGSRDPAHRPNVLRAILAGDGG